MKLALIIAVCIIFESVVYPYPATLLAVSFVSIFWEKDAAFLALISGIILDLLLLRTLGLTGMYFLLIIFIGSRYRKKIHSATFLYRFLFVFGSFILYNLIFYKGLKLTETVFSIILAIAAIRFFSNFFLGIGKNKLQI